MNIKNLSLIAVMIMINMTVFLISLAYLKDGMYIEAIIIFLVGIWIGDKAILISSCIIEVKSEEKSNKLNKFLDACEK